MRRTVLTLTLAALGLTLPASARAEDAFAAALRKSKLPDGLDCGWLAEALLLRPERTDVREQLATCEEQAGSQARAAARWSELGHEARLRADARDYRGPRLVVRAPAVGIPGLRVEVDGLVVPHALFGGMPVSAGEHEVVVTAPGRVAVRERVAVLDVGGTFTVPDLAPVAAPREAGPAPKPVPTRARSPEALVAGGVLLGLGLAGTVAGVSLSAVEVSDSHVEGQLKTAGVFTLVSSLGVVSAAVPLLAWGGKQLPRGTGSGVEPLAVGAAIGPSAFGLALSGALR